MRSHLSFQLILLGIFCVVFSNSFSTTPMKTPNPWKHDDASLLHRVYHPSKVPKDGVDYIIIGSGIGGLWLGACLSKFNITSLVLEQHYTAGGFQHTFWKGPYEFVPGLHYIANLPLCAPLYDMVASNQVTYHQAGNSVPADRGEMCSHELKIGDLPVMQVRQGKENVRKELVRVFPEEEKAIDEFIALMEKAKWQAGKFATFKIFPKWLQFLTSQLLCSTYINYASRTTEEVLGEMTDDGRLKTVLSAFGGDLGESISEGSFVMQAAVLGHVLEGCHFPQGGPIQFVRGLVPTIRQAGGEVLVKARVEEILVDEDDRGKQQQVRRVRLVNGDILTSRKGVVSDAGMGSTLKLLSPNVVKQSLASLQSAVNASSEGISHVFTFVGLNASHDELGLRSSSFYYIPWNETNKGMDASAIQDFYRNTLLDPSVRDVSAGIVFASAKDPEYCSSVMPGKSTVIIFSEAKVEDFLKFQGGTAETAGNRREHGHRASDYEQAKKLIETKMIRSLLLNFPHLEPYIDLVEVGSPLTLFDYTRRMDSLGLRHTPQRMCDTELRPDCNLEGLYFTGQDVAFAGWAGALAGGMVTAQKLLGYTLQDFMNKKTLLRALGKGELEDMIQEQVQEGTAASPLETAGEVAGNAWRHIRLKFGL